MRTADFKRVLATAPRGRSAHFAAHHLAARPTLPGAGGKRSCPEKLSTSDPATCPPAVDECPDQWWLGLVVPKRFARRAVTRNLLKRQMRARMAEAAGAALAPRLPGGLWVLRLKAPFTKASFPSAGSAALREAVHGELRDLLRRAALR